MENFYKTPYERNKISSTYSESYQNPGRVSNIYNYGNRPNRQLPINSIRENVNEPSNRITGDRTTSSTYNGTTLLKGINRPINSSFKNSSTSSYLKDSTTDYTSKTNLSSSSSYNKSNNYNGSSLDNTYAQRKPFYDLNSFHNYNLYDNKENSNNAYSSSTTDKLKNLKLTEETKPSSSLNKSSKAFESTVGLDNLGNTCYMNTVLQILIHTPPFIEAFLKEFTTSNSSTNINEITSSFYDLLINYINESKTSFNPTKFKRTFALINPKFSGYSQQDSMEFLRTLLEDISNGLNRIKKKPAYQEISTKNKTKEQLRKEYWDYFSSRENSIITDIFYGQIVNIFNCLDCGNETYSFENFLDIPVLFDDEKSNTSVHEILSKHFKSEKIKFDVPCNKCKRKSYHNKTMKISKSPEVLIITLLRYSNRTSRKSTAKLSIKEKLDLSEFIDLNGSGSNNNYNNNVSNRNKIFEDSSYNLYGVAHHTGSMDFGHYYAYCKIKPQWFEFNDEFVSKLNGDLNRDSLSAYALFYSKNNN